MYKLGKEEWFREPRIYGLVNHWPSYQHEPATPPRSNPHKAVSMSARQKTQIRQLVK